MSCSTISLPHLACALALLACTWASETWAQGGDAVAKGNQEYGAGRFAEAIKHYEEAVAAGLTSGALFYNLGNARYRSGDLGRAILNYERALLLEPQHPEAEANLRVVRDKARALELKATWADRLTSRASPGGLSVAAAAAFWICAFALAGLFLPRRRSPALLGLAVISALVLATAAGVLYWLEVGRKGRALAVVTGKNIEARLATADNAGSVLALPAGSEIKILSTRGDWIYAALPNDLRGWIPANSAERVRL
ncbi:MAG: tetratricopeptide repeat protein [Chthoniobacterales bacterium]